MLREILSFIGGMGVGIVLICIVVLWNTSTRKLIRDRLGLTDTLSSLHSGTRAIMGDVDSIGQEVGKILNNLPTVIKQLNRNTEMMMRTRRELSAFAAANPGFRRVSDRVRDRMQKEYLDADREGTLNEEVNEEANAAEAPDPDRCQRKDCNHPKAAHAAGACAATGCNCDAFVEVANG